MNTLGSLLTSYKKQKIHQIDISVNQQKIRLQFKDLAPIEFTGVRSFLYVEDDLTFSDDKEVGSIEFYEEGFVEFVSSDDEFEEIFSVPNFSLDLRDKSLLIEAENISIGGKNLILNKMSQ